MLTTIAVIPARYASTRFPGKALAAETGKFLIQHVCEQVRVTRSVSRVIVATDDQRIVEAVRSFGGEVCLTKADHPSGTSRVAEVAAGLDLGDDDLVLNVQGDEPEIEPEALDELVVYMDGPGRAFPIGTLAARFDDAGSRTGPGSPLDPSCVKVVLGAQGRALYFSRSLVPYPRATKGAVDKPSRWLLHLGVYAFRAGTLRELGQAGAVDEQGLEACESLEQLGWLEAGRSIGVVVVPHPFVGIDTPEDYAAFVTRVGKRKR